MEEWRPIPGYVGLYEASSLGRIRRVGKAHRSGKGRGGGARIGLVLKLQLTQRGYLAVMLWREGKLKRFQVHRLIASAFIAPVPADKDVNHKDGSKTNNAPSNLEIATRSENNKHAYATKLRVVTEKQRTSQSTPTCPRGHDMTGENVSRRPGGSRYCKTCNRERAAANRSKTKQRAA